MVTTVSWPPVEKRRGDTLEAGGHIRPTSERPRQPAAKRAECKRQQVITIGNIREKNRSSEGVSAKRETPTKGLQSPVHRFDSGRRFQRKPANLRVLAWMKDRADLAGTRLVQNPYLFSDAVDGSVPWRPIYVSRWFPVARDCCNGAVRPEVHFHGLPLPFSSRS